MKGRSLAAAVALALLGSPDLGHQRAGQQLLPKAPRTRPNGIRRGTVKPWNARENERRRRQIERGIIRATP